MASESLRYLLEGWVLQESHRGFSRPIFDLPPNPSIDHLVPVILKYPRREESGWRMSLSPGLMDGTR